MRAKSCLLVVTAIVFITPLVVQGAEGEGALVDAVRQRDMKAVRTLASKADVNAAGPDGTTALHWAARSDDLEIVRLLIARGADVRATNRYGITPMWQAALNGNAQIIEALAAAGAPVDAALAYPALVDILEAAFAKGAIAPPRHHHAIALDGRPEATLLLSITWSGSRSAISSTRNKSRRLAGGRPPCCFAPRSIRSSSPPGLARCSRSSIPPSP